MSVLEMLNQLLSESLRIILQDKSQSILFIRQSHIGCTYLLINRNSEVPWLRAGIYCAS